MESFIVRVRSYMDDECIQNGTGIVVSKNVVLTAKHVVKGDCHKVFLNNKEYVFELIPEACNDVVVLLRAIDDSICFSNIATIFTEDEILDEDTKWTVNGYITEELLQHSMVGKGIIVSSTEESNWDYYLANIEAGKSNNYGGLSGSPVFVNNRIVGILQMQSTNINGNLGVRLSSVKMFIDVLSDKNVMENEYLQSIREETINYSLGQVNKNIKSKKYIPNIFVEEAEYKENLRYFADPGLFIKKAISSVKQLDFSNINQLLKSRNERQIDYSLIPENYTLGELDSIGLNLLSETIYALDKIEQLEKSNYSDVKSDISTFYDIRQNCFNNSLKFYLENIKANVLFTQKNYILLTKDAGQGKTNFLCDFTKNFLIKKNYIVLYFNAYELRDNIMDQVKKILTRYDTCTFEYANKVFMKEWVYTKKPIVIVIDGLNENTVVDNFGLAVKEFLEECNIYPYIKVIMTTRNEFLEERFSVIEDATYIDKYMHINMFMRSDKFKDRIFWGYINNFGISIRKNTITDRSYKILTDDILLLRFFCEVNENKQQLYLYDIYKYEVFEEYIEKKAAQYCTNWKKINSTDEFYSLLNKIAKYMVNNKEYFKVPVEFLDTRGEVDLLASLLDNDVILKGEEVVAKRMLSRKKTVISFTFDEFRDFCLTNYILENYTQEEIHTFWKYINQETPTIKEGVQKYSFYLARTRTQESLLPILQSFPEYDDLYWRYIWGLEDQYYTEDDREKWKQHVLQNGKNDKRVVYDLLMKYDVEYFENININLLFEILNQLSSDLGKYRDFVRKMFDYEYEDRHSYLHNQNQGVWPINCMVENIGIYIDDNEWNTQHIEIYRLTIYLVELDSWEISELWEKLYMISPGIVVSLLTKLNNHSSSIINSNVKEILSELKKHQRLDEFDDKVEELLSANTFSNELNVDVDDVLEWIRKLSHENN